MARLKNDPAARLVRAIFDTWPRRARDEVRRHLGGSEIGASCSRAVWYSFRWAERPKFAGQMLRLFNRGDREEPMMVDDLRALGLEVQPFDPAFPDEERQRRAFWLADHFSHGADALVRTADCPEDLLPEDMLSDWFLGEFKTANAKKWAELEKVGLEKANPKYWAQCHVGMLGHGVDWCLFLSVCKNDDAIYAEWIRLDRAFAERCVERARQVIEAPVPPPKLAESPAYFECKFCDYAEQCHFKALPRVHCRTCAHSSPSMEGPGAEWTCALAPGQFIPRDVELTGCASHVFLPQLVPLEIVDADPTGDWVEYRKKDETLIRNGGGHVRSVDFGKAIE